MANTVDELALSQTTTAETHVASCAWNLERDAMLDEFEALLAEAERVTKSAASNANARSEAAAVNAHCGEQS